MKGQKKENEDIQRTLDICASDYTKLLIILQERKEMVDAMPHGKEKNFLMRDYEDWYSQINACIEFKRGLMERMRIEGDAVTYVYSKKALKEMHKKLKKINFKEEDDNDDIPNER